MPRVISIGENRTQYVWLHTIWRLIYNAQSAHFYQPDYSRH